MNYKVLFMRNETTTKLNSRSLVSAAGGWIFGTLFLAIGLINSFWGNDPGFGVFIVLLSLAYFPPVNDILRERTGFTIPVLWKVLAGLFIIWASVGVGELFDKIDLMLASLR